MNNAYKNVYKILMIVTVISMIVVCLTSLDVIDLTSETGLIIGQIATMFLLISFLFSRNAGVIANRKNILANIITLVILIVLLFFTITLIFKDVNLPEWITKIMGHALIISTLMTLIFEIPQANSAHGNFQKLVAIATIVTYFIFIGYTNKQEAYMEKMWDWNTDYSQLEKEAESLESYGKIFQVALYISLTGFIINPMLRVYYIDRDYASMNDIDEILYSSAKNNIYNTNPNPTKVIDPKYLNPTVAAQNQQTANNAQIYQSSPTPAPTPAPQPQPEPVVELPREKVVNPNFKQEDLPEAIIPTITANQQPVEVPPTAETPKPEQTSTPLEMPVVKPEAETTIEPTQSTEVPQPTNNN